MKFQCKFFYIHRQEFILSYMVIEEKLRHKQMHLKQVIDEYTYLKEKYNKGLNENKEEIVNEYGVSINAEVTLSVIDCINLWGESPIGRIDPYVIGRLETSELKTHYQEDSNNPVFNEDLIL